MDATEIINMHHQPRRLVILLNVNAVSMSHCWKVHYVLFLSNGSVDLFVEENRSAVCKDEINHQIWINPCKRKGISFIGFLVSSLQPKDDLGHHVTHSNQRRSSNFQNGLICETRTNLLS
jgi:hypothetical protein